LGHLSNTLPLVPEEIYTPETLSLVLEVSRSTLARWRKSGTGPAYSQLPNLEIRYRGLDVVEWLEQRKPNGLQGSKDRMN
jgi:hypothetical protein